jgi:hypothetical protein
VGGSSKGGRNKVKCQGYRARVGKPAGRGMIGKHIHRTRHGEKSTPRLRHCMCEDHQGWKHPKVAPVRQNGELVAI